ncbi:uncharacterized protein STEHIDRAFT_150209 [Stereum hirsutum FP-91666 SS1]|uniref:uncharacterized protein n=1 Tax=Stereum hirsutum (strain FP-91666) TaxID=721885 RepID=UPI0004449D5E|nr:uncharacterized protein STEHIDRAFT_150209 [Stereum hirsutum FP-91666 SS1]EIM81221.1 hypothetical protein STEHIDRAFT_150209 [Stereum hirsutum FP-91666 SS1]
MSSTRSYRLETQRRPPPPPLRLGSNQSKRSSLAGAAITDTSDQLLYDIPTASPFSPPAAAANSRVTSPTSPTFSPRNSRSRHKSPPPKARTRSATPSKGRGDLEAFAQNCRKWFFEQDEEAGRLMTATMANVPSHQRAPFTRLQASIRSAYHETVRVRKTAEFRAVLSSTQPGGSLMPHSRADPSGPLAKKERLERFDRFVRSWCSQGLPGTNALFEGLWVLMRLQVVPEHLGGAGARRIQWEIDDAVFQEAAGKDFMLEAIDVLKGVLGFEENPSSRTSTSSGISQGYGALPPLHSRSQSQPLQSKDTDSSAGTGEASRPPLKRMRAPSDPFLDTPDLSHSFNSSSTQSSSAQPSSLAPSKSPSEGIDEPPSPLTPPTEIDDLFPKVPPDYRDEQKVYLRIWTSPDLANPELLALLKVFPTFISRRTLPRFSPAASSRRIPDVEEGGVDDADESENAIRAGTGRMWLSSRPRSGDWAGGWWSRFVLWWRRLFC